MPRHNGSGGQRSETKQKGTSRKSNRLGTYSRMNKRARAMRYDRPYLEGTYAKGYSESYRL